DIFLSGGDSCNQTFPVVINDVPQVDISFDTLVGCLPFVPSIINNTTAGPPGTPPSYTWTITGGSQGVEWNFIGGTDSMDAAPQIRFDSTGIYNLDVQIANECDTINQCYQVEVLDISLATLTIPTDTVCLGTVVSFEFSDSFVATTTLTTNGDTFLNPISPITYSYTQSGVFPVTYTASNSCGVTNASGQVVVQDVPSAGLTLSADTICEGDAVLFTLTGGYPGNDSTLDIGLDTLTSINGFLSQTYGTGTAGTYIIRYTIQNDCGTATALDTLTVLAPPSPSISWSQSAICVDSCLNVLFSYAPVYSEDSVRVTITEPDGNIVDISSQSSPFTYCPDSTGIPVLSGQ
ncbi:MAG: hypothetical protein AAFV78_20350, partial [Bacteroidota bacterium]